MKTTVFSRIIHSFRRFKFLPVVTLLTLLPVGCGDNSSGDTRTAGDGRLAVAAGLPPIGWIAAEIGGDRISVTTMLPEGRTPHDYSPSPRDIRIASESALFLTTGMPFEERVTRALPSSVKIVDVAAGIVRIPFGGCGHDHGDHDLPHDHEDEHHHGDEPTDSLDPHVWLSIRNDLTIAANIEKAFSAASPDNAAYFRANLERFTAKMSELEQRIVTKLAPWKGRSFYVYHPAFGYFAAMTGLRQEAIELGGREAGARRLEAIAESAREHQVRVIFVQPQFNPANARGLAEAINGEVRALDPLGADLYANFEAITGALRAGFSR